MQPAPACNVISADGSLFISAGTYPSGCRPSAAATSTQRRCAKTLQLQPPSWRQPTATLWCPTTGPGMQRAAGRCRSPRQWPSARRIEHTAAAASTAASVNGRIGAACSSFQPAHSPTAGCCHTIHNRSPAAAARLAGTPVAAARGSHRKSSTKSCFTFHLFTVETLRTLRCMPASCGAGRSCCRAGVVCGVPPLRNSVATAHAELAASSG